MKGMTSPLVQRLLGRRLTLDSRKHTPVLDEMSDAGEIQLESCISQVQPVRRLICPESP